MSRLSRRLTRRTYLLPEWLLRISGTRNGGKLRGDLSYLLTAADERAAFEIKRAMWIASKDTCTRFWSYGK